MEHDELLDLLEDSFVTSTQNAINKLNEKHGEKYFPKETARALVGRVGVRIVFGKDAYNAAYKK